MRRGTALRSYLAVSHLIPLIATPILHRRLKRGKEHSERWQEKLGKGLIARPQGTLVWLHAVGLGEVLSVRGLISRMAAIRPDLSFLVTSTTTASAEVFAKNAPARTIHQFLPLDAPSYRRRFLDHFTPDLCIWVEQDLWPGMVSDIAQRGIPQCMVAARMNDRSHKAHQLAAPLFRDLYRAMTMITAQDANTAEHLKALGADVQLTGSLKPAAPALTYDVRVLEQIKAHLGDRFVWTVAPAHEADIEIAKVANEQLRQSNPDALLIVAPRFPSAIVDDAAPRRSRNELPRPSDEIWLCDTFGELGLIYRLSKAVLIGGTFNEIEGHNPWEAARLGCAILHGPQIANFAADFALLDDASAAMAVGTADDIATALASQSFADIVAKTTKVIEQASMQTDALAAKLIGQLEVTHAA
jgi:3-deoxy-D-manno-octulosonic-acid transferase